jgi:hypothetical protein
MRRVLLTIALALWPSAGGAAPPAPPPAELIRVAANTGGAAGGHVALRLGDRVYHYQADEDLVLRFVRDHWSAFMMKYTVLENRSLELHRLALDEEAYRKIEARLTRMRTVNRLELARLEALQLETRWVEALGTEGASVSLPAVGLFAREERGDPATDRLRRAVQAHYGEGFLRTELTAVEEELRGGALRVSDLGGWTAAPGVSLPMSELVAERRLGLLLTREALRALDEVWVLAPDALVGPDAGWQARLSKRERASLERQGTELEASALRLLRSRRSDRGYPLLLALARHQAVHRSLALGRLVLLDPTPDGALVVSGESLRDRRESIERLAPAVRRAYLDARAAALAGGFDELRQNRLEGMATFAASLDAALGGEDAVRLWAGGGSPPSRSGPVPLPEVVPPPGWREEALAAARARQASARAPHDYDLFTRNCATELTRAIVSAFPDAEQAALALGGDLDPDDVLHFVPAGLAHAARRSWSVTETRELPSWRRQLVAGFEERENSLWVKLRESNTFTSRAYQGSFRDAPFVFFTEGHILIRPFQGVVNLGYGLAHASLGALTLPVDRGCRLRAGLEGALYSVPELVGVNIRKGRYDLPPITLAQEAQ